MVELRLLGPLEVWRDGRPLTLRGRRRRALLAALALQGEPVSAERLIDDLWGERPPPTAKSSLHNAVSILRKALGPDVLVSRPPGYALALDPERVDVVHFQRLADQARAAPSAEERVSALREALQLWRGPPLADLAFEPFALVEGPRLEELRLSAQRDLIEADLALGRHADVLPDLEALVSEHPFDERLRGQLMLALYRSGRQADALEAYGKTREFLVEELGLEPSPELRELQPEQLHRHTGELAAGHGRRLRTAIETCRPASARSAAISAPLFPEPTTSTRFPGSSSVFR
jgi:DNA-binding SARP family transcriptional activator